MSSKDLLATVITAGLSAAMLAEQRAIEEANWKRPVTIVDKDARMHRGSADKTKRRAKNKASAAARKKNK